MGALVDGRVGECAAGRIEDLTLRDWPRLPRFQLPCRREFSYRRRAQRQYPAQDFDLHPRNGPAVESPIGVLEPSCDRWHISLCAFATTQIHSTFLTLSPIPHDP